MRQWLYVITWKGLWHMPDICHRCKVETHGECVPTQIGKRCKCPRAQCRNTAKPTGGGFEQRYSLPDTAQTSLSAHLSRQRKKGAEKPFTVTGRE